MKRIFTVLMVSSLLCLYGCGGKNSAVAPSSPAASGVDAAPQVRSSAAVVSTCAVSLSTNAVGTPGTLAYCLNYSNVTHSGVADTITFTAAMAGRTITLSSAMAVSDATAGTLITNTSGGVVTISGNNGAYSCFNITSNNNQIDGLTIVKCKPVGSGAIVIAAAKTGNKITGNFIGTTPTSGAGNGNTYGVYVLGNTNTIGGSTTAERNIISANTGYGVAIAGNSNTVTGNYIGTNVGGTASMGVQTAGVAFLSTAASNTLGGTSSALRNVISGNGGPGVLFAAAGPTTNKVIGNYIGANAAGTAGIANGGGGVSFTATASSNTIGGSTAGEPNIIAYNSGVGVSLFSGAIRNKISRNQIYTNSGAGIALNSGNASIATPTISSVTAFMTGYNVTGTITCPAFPCTVELFRADNTAAPAVPADAAGGEGYLYLSSATVAAGTAFSFSNVTIAAGGTKVTVTVTDANGNTSAFSANVAIPAANVAPAVSACSFLPASIERDGVTTTTLTCTVTDTNLSTVTANMSALGGSATAAMTNTSGTTWKLIGFIPALTSAVITHTITITATDTATATGTGTASLTLTNTPPVVSACSFAPATVVADGVITSTLTCTVVDTNLSTVTANLTAIGGSATAPLTNTTGTTWKIIGLIPVPTSALIAHTITITATDTLANTGTSTASLTLTNAPPTVATCSFLPTSVPADSVTTTILTCTVSDPNNNLTTVTADLSAFALGGTATDALTRVGATNTWRRTGIIAIEGLLPNPNTWTVTIRATDALAATATKTTTLATTVPLPTVKCTAGNLRMPHLMAPLADGELLFPTEVAVDIASLNIYVTNTSNNRIEQYVTNIPTNPVTCAFVRRWGSLGSGNTQFNQPKGIVFANNQVYVSDASYIRVFSPTGTFVSRWAIPAGSVSIAADLVGNIYLLHGTGKVYRYGATGTALTPPTWTVDGASGITVSDANVMYISNAVKGIVTKYEIVNGTAQGTIGSLGTGNGQLKAPKSISVATGFVYVADTGNNRMSVFNESTGAFFKTVGAYGRNNGQFYGPTDVIRLTVGTFALVVDQKNDRMQIYRYFP